MNDHPIGSVWKLASNRGWEALECTVLDHLLADPASGVLVDVVLTGEFWDQGVPVADAALTQDFQLRFPQVVVSLAKVRALEAALREYLGQPIDQLQAGALAFRVDLGLAGYQFDLHFGASAEVVASSDKPIVSVTLSRGHGVRCQTMFVTDPSCVRAFADALGSFLRTAGANGA